MIADRLQSWTEQEDAEYFKHVPAVQVVGRISGKVHEVVHRQPRVGAWAPARSSTLYEIARHLVAKDYFPSDVFSGLVIAGFGEHEHFPAVLDLQIGGIYGGRLKVRPASLVQVTDEKPSHVMSFAYTDMVDAFLNGISPNGARSSGRCSSIHRGDAPVGVGRRDRPLPMRRNGWPGQFAGRAIEGERIAQNVLEVSDSRKEEIKRVVETLTIGELAKVASTLVGMSSFEHQMSLDRESVGGPVDVAVISKGDGFIWMDRKHYFSRELNEHFFRNYNDDDDAPGVDEAAHGKDEEVPDGE